MGLLAACIDSWQLCQGAAIACNYDPRPHALTACDKDEGWVQLKETAQSIWLWAAAVGSREPHNHVQNAKTHLHTDMQLLVPQCTSNPIQASVGML
jgi:hypothetical protein